MHQEIAQPTLATRALPLKITMILIVSLFFLWGVANHLNDVLIPQFKKAFALSDLQSGLVQAAFYIGYFVFAMPAALFMQRYGYKAAVVFGLVLYGTGALLFYPAAQLSAYAAFLAALFVLASGLAFLETSANPLVAAMGDPASAARRLNFAQAFNPLGAITGVLIGRTFILSGVEYSPAELAALTPEHRAAFHAAETSAVQTPYLVLGAVVLFWALLVALARFPAIAGEDPRDRASPASFGGLRRQPNFLFGVVAQFFYVGAQVGIWSYFIRYSQFALPGTGEKIAASYLTCSLVGFMVGRFAGTALMSRLAPHRLMAVFAAINVALALTAALAGGAAGVLALAATSFFMSIMFPTIFALALRDLGPLTKPGASLLVMAIIGGAVLTAAMGRISDLASIEMAMLVPAGCFVVIWLFAMSQSEKHS